MNQIEAVAWICIENRKILCVKSKKYNVWFLPGGKREKGESDKEALIREVKEELGVDLLPETITYLHTFKTQAHRKPEGVFVKMTCYTANYSGTLQSSSEIKEMKWLTSNTNPYLLSSLAKKILAYLKEKDLID